jgi:hypothetical protein
MGLGRYRFFTVVFFVLGSISACQTRPHAITEPPRPAVSLTENYVCANGGTLSVQSTGSTVRVTNPDGLEIELPSSPAGSISRYGKPPYALLMSDGDALWMKAGSPPLDCRKK